MGDSQNDGFIASDQLTAAAIPKRASDWHAVTRFAVTFDTQSVLANDASVSGVADIQADSSIPEMRLAIYSEWRRYNHRTDVPDAAVVQKTQNVLDQLRLKIHQDTAHVVFLRSSRLLLVKRPDADWRQLQDDYTDYMTSLGPWTAFEIALYFSDDYGDDDSKWPFSKWVIADFFSSTNKTEIEAE
jgi:hypothetical protein